MVHGDGVRVSQRVLEIAENLNRFARGEPLINIVIANPEKSP